MKKCFSMRNKLLIIFGLLVALATIIEGLLAIQTARKAVTEKILAGYVTDTEANNAAKYCKHISPNGYVPSEAEASLIFHAIRGNKITGLPTFSQTTNIGGSFSGKTAYFWTSTQSDTSKAYVINLVKDELLYSGKVEEVKTNVRGFICPIVYYDDEGKVVK